MHVIYMLVGGVSSECDRCTRRVCSSEMWCLTAATVAVVQQRHPRCIHSSVHFNSERRVHYSAQVYTDRLYCSS